MVHYLIYLVALDPEYIPVVIDNFFVMFVLEGIQDAVPEYGFEFDVGKVSRWVMLFLYVFPKVFRHFFVYFINYYFVICTGSKLFKIRI